MNEIIRERLTATGFELTATQFVSEHSTVCALHKQSTKEVECVHLTKCHQYIFSVSLKSGAYYITGQWGKFIKKCYLILLYTFLAFFFFFYQKICVFIIFIFLDEVSNFRNRILTNQKRGLVVSNCQWNCMGGRNNNSFCLLIIYIFLA